jgi:hypothetical protein
LFPVDLNDGQIYVDPKEFEVLPFPDDLQDGQVGTRTELCITLSLSLSLSLSPLISASLSFSSPRIYIAINLCFYLYPASYQSLYGSVDLAIGPFFSHNISLSDDCCHFLCTLSYLHVCVYIRLLCVLIFVSIYLCYCLYVYLSIYLILSM